MGIWVSIAETCADNGKFLQGGWKRVGYSRGHKECLVPGAMYTVPPHPRPPSPRTPGQHMCRCIYHRGMLDGQLISHLRCWSVHISPLPCQHPFPLVTHSQLGNGQVCGETG